MSAQTVAMKHNKVLVIGNFSALGIDSCRWWDSLPNLTDYDVIILDTVDLRHSFEGRLESLKEKERYHSWNFGGGSGVLISHRIKTENDSDLKLFSNLELIQTKLIEKLPFGAQIYVIYLPGFYVHSNRLDKAIFTDGWCPLKFKVVKEVGETINVKDASYEKYLSNCKTWNYYFETATLNISKVREYYSGRYDVSKQTRILAANAVEKAVALQVTFQFTARSTSSVKNGGSLVFLPPVSGESFEAITAILERGRFVLQELPPEWVNAIVLPSEPSLAQQVSATEKKLNALKQEFGEITNFKTLLYASGLKLQDTVRAALQKLGAKVVPSVVTDEFIIEVGEKRALIEVKGNSKSISKNDIPQLMTDKARHFTETGEAIKGILVGNAWRNLLPDQRDTRDKPIFPGNIVKIAEDENIGLLSTTALFDAICQMLEKPQSKEENLRKIIGGKGVICI